jgi:hypothetical protein
MGRRGWLVTWTVHEVYVGGSWTMGDASRPLVRMVPEKGPGQELVVGGASKTRGDYETHSFAP